MQTLQNVMQCLHCSTGNCEHDKRQVFIRKNETVKFGPHHSFILGLKQSMIEFKRKKSTNKVFYFVNPYLKLYFDVLSSSIQGSNSTSNKQISDESFLTGSVGINVTVGSDREN